MEDTREQTIDWAIKYIISGTGLIWLRDAFNACCKEQEEICHVQNNFDIDEVRKYLENEPMIKCVANKKKIDWEELEIIVEDFICKYFMVNKENVTSKDIYDILIIANKNKIKYEVRNSILDSCQKHLDIVHLQKLEQVLNQIIANPELTELSIDWKNENK